MKVVNIGTTQSLEAESILLDGKHESAYNTMKIMINDDFLKIIKTFKFN